MKHYPILGRLVCLCFALMFFISGYAQNISGVVNTYWQVATSYTNYVQLTNIVAGFGASHTLVPGDMVMLLTMKNASTGPQGEIANYGKSGGYQIAKVTSISGNLVYLDATVSSDIWTPSTVQMVWIPVYHNATVTGTLTALDWDPSLGVGGILALSATTLTLQADIDVSGQGFKGGVGMADNDGVQCTGFNAENYTNANGGGMKGEGIGEGLVYWGYNYGRGSDANGGGGGNSHGAGGAGGCNAGNGGSGGNDFQNISSGYTSCSGEANGGRTTPAIDYVTLGSTKKIFFGGGGGAGHAISPAGFCSGADGGGIAIIRAGTLNGSGTRAIRADGASALLVSQNGAGGGGGGGSILLDVCTFNYQPVLSAKGGVGGSINESNPIAFSGVLHGPGGGGGGGIIRFTSASVPSWANVASNVAGGANGTTTGSAARGAASGATGIINGNTAFATNLTGIIDFSLLSTFCGLSSISVNPSLSSTSVSSIFIEVWSGSSYYVSGWYSYTSGQTYDIVSLASTRGTPMACGKTYNVKVAINYGSDCMWSERVKQTTVYCQPTYNGSFIAGMNCAGATATATCLTGTPPAGTTDVWVVLKQSGGSWLPYSASSTTSGTTTTFTGLTKPGTYRISHAFKNSDTYCNQGPFSTQDVTCTSKTDGTETTDTEMTEVEAVNGQDLVDAIDIASIQLFPNPANAKIELRMPGEYKGNMQVAITDVTGKVVLQLEEGANGYEYQHQFDISQLAAGHYFVTVKNNQQFVATTRFVKE